MKGKVKYIKIVFYYIHMNPENFVYYQKGGKVLSMGYEIDSRLLNDNLPAVDGNLNGLAVPCGLFLLKHSIDSNTKPKKEFEIIRDDDAVIDDNLYDSLLDLMNPKSEQKKTRSKKSKTRRRHKKAKKNKRKTKSKRD